jgi:hypothetical protein
MGAFPLLERLISQGVPPSVDTLIFYDIFTDETRWYPLYMIKCHSRLP